MKVSEIENLTEAWENKAYWLKPNGEVLDIYPYHHGDYVLHFPEEFPELDPDSREFHFEEGYELSEKAIELGYIRIRISTSLGAVVFDARDTPKSLNRIKEEALDMMAGFGYPLLEPTAWAEISLQSDTGRTGTSITSKLRQVAKGNFKDLRASRR